jgi:hypothetical protein
MIREVLYAETLNCSKNWDRTIGQWHSCRNQAKIELLIDNMLSKAHRVETEAIRLWNNILTNMSW